MVILGVVFWLLFAAIVALIAGGQRREPLIWFVVALLLSPLIAFAILLIVGDVLGVKAEPSESAVTLRSATARELLARLEEKLDGGMLGADEIAQLKTLAQREPPPPNAKPLAASPAASPAAEFTRPCPSCGRLIHPKATTCMHCLAKVAGDAA